MIKFSNRFSFIARIIFNPYIIYNDRISILLNLLRPSNRPKLYFDVFQLNEKWFIGLTEELKRDFFKRIFASYSQINSLGSVFFRFFIYLLISLKNTILFSKKDNIFTSWKNAQIASTFSSFFQEWDEK